MLRSVVRRVRLRWLSGAALAVFAGLSAEAQPVLHEFVPDVRQDEVLVLSVPGSSEPAAIVYDGQILPAPQDGALEPDERAMVAMSGDGMGRDEPGRRSPSFRPDRITSLESTLGYFEVFTPSISPFKRVSALDTVLLDGRVPVLQIADATPHEVPVVGVSAEPSDDRERDRFWGSVVVDFSQGRTVPMPSVSPESRILSFRTEPPANVRVQKDAADNFYATAEGPLPAMQIRLTWLTDAPRVYFNADEIPNAPSDALAEHATELPPWLERDAIEFARQDLGLRRGDALPHVLSVLTNHFRSFTEADEPPEDTGNIYLDLARGMRGVCRHRTYAFMITALALGIPARFVMNEAHAWAEVEMPEVGWMRIDLGGSAAGLESHNDDDRPVYRPVNDDPLPRPETYEASYSRQAIESASSPGSENGGENGELGSDNASRGDSSSGDDGTMRSASSDSTRRTRSPEPEPGQPRGDLRLILDQREFQVFRGRQLELHGRALSVNGDPVSDLRVEALLVGDDERLLGVTLTSEAGSFHGAFGVPPDLPVGDYTLVVRTPGNRSFGPTEVR